MKIEAGAAQTGGGNRYDALTVYERRYIVVHLVEAGQCDLAQRLLTTLDFLAAKAVAGMIDGLLQDYQLLQRSQTSGVSALADSFSRFLAHQAHFLREVPAMLQQQAANSDEEAVSGRARETIASAPSIRPWLRKLSGHARSQHSGQIISLAFWRNEAELVAATTTREVWVWNLSRGTLDRRCDAPPSAAKSLSISPDGSYLAAAFGAAEPTPHDAGVIVWGRRGEVYRRFTLDDWAYHARWRDSDEIIVGAGLPHGSEAGGSLWRLRLGAATREEIGRLLADRPIVFSWDHGQALMTLDLEGRICRLTPDYAPISQRELDVMPMPIKAGGSTDWSGWPAAVDAHVAARRPTVDRICAPASGTFGFHPAVSRLNGARICVLGGPPVPPEIFAWHTPSPDGVYMYDAVDGSGGVFRFSPAALESGLQALCVGAAADGTLIAVGFNDGSVVVLPSGPLTSPPKTVPRQSFPVTAVAVSDTHRLLALGGDQGEVVVLDVAQGTTVFRTGGDRRPNTVRIIGGTALRLEDNRLVHIDLDNPDDRMTIELPEGAVALDVDMAGEQCAVVVSASEGAAPTFAVQWIDLAMRCLGARWSLQIPNQENLTIGRPRTEIPSVRLRRRNGKTSLLQGSAVGFSEIAPGSPRAGQIFMANFMGDRPERQLTVMRMGSLPESLEVFAPAPDGRLTFAGYADNQDHPRVSGIVRAWDHDTGVSTSELRLPARVSTMAVAGSDIVLVGSDDGRATAWRWNDSWLLLSAQQHTAEIVAVAFARHGGLACSASGDGHVRVWSYADPDGPNLQTFIDVKPAAVGFFDGDGALALVDRNGEIYRWKIELPRS